MTSPVFAQVFVAGAAALLLVGCSSASGDLTAQNPFYQADFEEAMKESNEFQRAILKDGVITQAEYYEAQDAYSKCMEDQGYELIPDRVNGGYHLGFSSADPVAMQITFECARESVLILEDLFIRIRNNPENEDFNDVIARCLVRHDLVPNDFTGDDFRQAMEGYGEKVTVSAEDFPQGGYVELPKESEFMSLPVFPGGLSFDSPEVSQCRMNPQE